jgi:hypothetical protein
MSILKNLAILSANLVLPIFERVIQFCVPTG